MRAIISCLLLLFGIFIHSCQPEQNQEFITEEELKIKTGLGCGWCAGYDSLTITKNTLTYEYFGVCDTPDVTETVSTSPDDWKELVSLIDLETFGSIEINTCAICADGCDTSIKIDKEGFSHQVRFSSIDQVESIRPLAEKLEAMNNRFREGIWKD